MSIKVKLSKSWSTQQLQDFVKVAIFIPFKLAAIEELKARGVVCSAKG